MAMIPQGCVLVRTGGEDPYTLRGLGEGPASARPAEEPREGRAPLPLCLAARWERICVRC